MSQKTPIKKEIEGEEFVFTMMPPRKARKWVNRALKHLSSGVGVLGDAAIQKGMDSAMPVGGAISTAFESLEPELLDQFMDELADYSMYREIPLRESYDAVFLGRPGLQYAWFLTAVEVQFRDFLPVISSWLRNRFGEDTKDKLASLSQVTSTG